MKKKLLMVLLSLAMVITTTPAVAFAEGEGGEIKYKTPVISLYTQSGTATYGEIVESQYDFSISQEVPQGANPNEYKTRKEFSSSDLVLNWYADAEGTTAAAKPRGVTSSIDEGVCYITNSETTPAGSYYFNLVCPAEAAGGEAVSSNVASYVVNKKTATITSGSAEMVYDGTPLTCEEAKVTGFINGDGVEITFTGSQTEVGTSANTFTYEAGRGTDLSNYAIAEGTGATVGVGELTVEAQQTEAFAVKGANYNAKYDGDEHAFQAKVINKGDVDVTSKWTRDGAVFNYSTSTDGTNWSTWSSSQPEIKDAGKIYVKARVTYAGKNYDSNVYTMTVQPREIILTSESASKEYDGTSLKAGNVAQSGDGFAGTEGFDGVPSANLSISKVGTVTNDITVPAFKSDTKESNYTIVKNCGTLKVSRNSTPITITTASNSKIYDGTAIGVGTVTYTSGVLVNGDELTVTLKCTGDKAVMNAGVYDNEIKSYMVTNGGGEDVTNCYTFNKMILGKLTIYPRNLTLTSASAAKVYDGTPLTTDSVTIGGGGLAGEDALTYSNFASVTAATAVPVDNTFDYAAAAGNSFNPDNYNITVKYGKLMVTEGLALMAPDQEFTYDGTAHEAPTQLVGGTGTIEYSTSTDAQNWSSYSQTVPTCKDAGQIYIKSKGISGAQIVTAEYTLKVNPRKVTIATPSATKYYDATALTTDNTYSISGEGFIGDEGLNTLTVQGSQLDAGSSENTCLYTLKNSTKAGNYEITLSPGTLTVKKNPKKITIATAADSQAYNGMELNNAGYTVNWGKQQVDDDKLCGTDKLQVFTTGAITNVGKADNSVEYKVMRGTLDVTDNYTFTEPKLGTLEVKPRSIVVKTASAEKVYDGTPLTNSKYSLGGDGFVDGEGIIVNVTGTRTNAGTAKNKATFSMQEGTDTANYKITVEPGTLKVNKRKVTVVSGSAACIENDIPEAGLTNPECTIGGDGFVEGEAEPKGVGVVPKNIMQLSSYCSYDNTIDYGWKNNGKPSNYSITEITGRLVGYTTTVDKNETLSYVGIYDGQAHDGLTFYQGATIVSYSIDKKDVTDPSKEWVTSATLPTFTDVLVNKTTGELESRRVDVKLSGGKYYSYTVTILPRELTLTAGSASKVYDGTPLTCSDYIVGGDGFAAGEEQSISISMTSASSQTNVGSGVNQIQELVSNGNFKTSNYSISYTNGTLEVTKRPVTIISNSIGTIDKIIYDGSVKTSEGFVDVGKTDSGSVKSIGSMGFVGDDGIEVSEFFASAKNAGLYRNTFTHVLKQGTNIANYDIKCISGFIKISPREVTLTSASAEKTYDGTALTKNEVAVGGDGFVDGEGASYDVSGAQTAVGSSANKFTYTLNDGTLAGNYKISTQEGTLTVKEQPYVPEKSIEIEDCSINLEPQTLVWNGKVQHPTVTMHNTDGELMVEGVDYTVEFEDSVKVGMYGVMIVGIGKYDGGGMFYYRIVPSAKAIKSLAAGKKSLTVKWTGATKSYRSQIDGYQIKYSTSKKFTKSTTKTRTAKKSAKSLKIKGLRSHKRYYVKMRSYKVVDGTKYYSDWSKVKSKKVK